MTKKLDEKYQKVLKNFKGDLLAADVFVNKYALKNEKDELLEFSLSDLKNRLINTILTVENKDLDIRKKEFQLLLDYFLPAGRILYALGNTYNSKTTYSNCYYIPIEDDSIEGIYNTASKQARIFSYGGGVGLDISILRPRGAKVNNSAKTTTGAVSFMDLFSANTGLIGQHGRRGATAITISIDHPDVIDFIKIKGGKDKSKIQYANISVKFSNKFMEQLISNPESDWEMIYTLKNGEQIIRKENIQFIWDIFVENNYVGAEPGTIFWDNIITNYASCFEETKPQGINPCAEQALEAYGSCNLGSINISKLVVDPFLENCYFDFDKFKILVKHSVRFLSNINILNIERQPLPELKQAIINGNKVGVGLMGIADCIIKMNLKYDTIEAVDFVEKIMKMFKEESIKSSIEIAKERGMCKILEKYKNTDKWNEFINHAYFEDLDKETKKDLMNYGIGNIGLTSIAPTGSIAIIDRCSSGIEPIFSLSYDRTVHQAGKNGEKTKYTVYHPLVEEYNSIFGENAHLKNKNFITSKDIDWKMRIEIQSIITKYITDSVSSTINLPSDISKEIVSEIYKTAWKKQLKGITIYRDGSREGVLTESKKQYDVVDEYKFPDEGLGFYKVIRSEGRKWYCWITIDDETKLPNALFVNTNKKAVEPTLLTDDVVEHLVSLAKKYIKNGHLDKLLKDVEATSQANTIRMARLLGMLLRHRVPIIEIIKTIDIINPPVYSFIFQIKKLLGNYLPDNSLTGDHCTECDSMLVYEGGCAVCKNCGWSRC